MVTIKEDIERQKAAEIYLDYNFSKAELLELVMKMATERQIKEWAEEEE